MNEDLSVSTSEVIEGRLGGFLRIHLGQDMKHPECQGERVDEVVYTCILGLIFVLFHFCFVLFVFGPHQATLRGYI